MKFFKREEEEQPDPVLEKLREQAAAEQLPPYVIEAVERELDLLFRIGAASAEYTIGLAYVEYLLSLPWVSRTEDNLDLARAERILDEEHYGLKGIKERILEHLAVRKLGVERKPRILIVDDEEIARKNLAHVLGKERYSVETATNGVEAVARLGEKEFDVVLTDLKMPVMDGMGILERVKASSPGTQIIVVTGYGTIDSAVDAMRKGAFHYVTKPFKLDEVRAVVGQALGKWAARKTQDGSVLCFAGPPGTGKTSMGRSIAMALGRRFCRISLGGIKDEAEIRGHRRTYAGAKPGRILEEIRRLGSMNPVIVLDELDKIGYDVKGDPSSALLEVLDPEQNARFMDHYLDLPFDLSEVIFIITANIADQIMEPLRDRMEVLAFSGYTEEEKEKIASRFLIPRQVRACNLQDSPPRFTSEAVTRIIREYTHEAGIRTLNREVASVCRKVARGIVANAGDGGEVTVTPEMVERLLGPRRYFQETAHGTERVGVTTGLVLTDAGGEIVFVETAAMRGKGELIITGSLGDVMKESAQAALSFLRSNAQSFGIPEDLFREMDLHVHVPSGAVRKDGPSAGLTIAMALLSRLTGRSARGDVAMSGEITLTGRILPVGGLKEKLLAARRAGIGRVIFPERNRAAVEESGEEARRGLEIFYCDDMTMAVDAVLL